LSVTMSFRLPGAEADSIREAARAAGMSLSEWIRQVASVGKAGKTKKTTRADSPDRGPSTG
jgi:hypothetical protein